MSAPKDGHMWLWSQFAELLSIPETSERRKRSTFIMQHVWCPLLLWEGVHQHYEAQLAISNILYTEKYCFSDFISMKILNKQTHLTIWKAVCTILFSDSECTFLIDVPFSPKSYATIVPLSDNVYNIWRLLSTEICEIASSSLNAAFINDGTRKDSALLEWFTFLHLLPHQPSSFWNQ